MSPNTLQTAAIIEMDSERDRKECIKLDLKVSGANRDLAQWIVDHPRYSAEAIASWLGCGATRIKELRKWAANGFVKTPSQERYERRRRRTSDDAALKDNDILEDGPDEDSDSDQYASADVIEDELIHTLQRAMQNASAYQKILRGAPSLDLAACERIGEAINRLIAKWKSVQATLTRKGKSS